MKTLFKNMQFLLTFARIIFSFYLLFVISTRLMAQPKLFSLKSDFQVNENAGFCDQNNADAGIDGAGNAVVVWEDARNGNWDIYGQRYNPMGEAIGGNFKINTDTNNRTGHHNAAVAVAADGHFIVVWQHAEHEAIYGQMYDSQGQPVGGNFEVDDPALRQGQVAYPEISLNHATGEFVVVWDDFHHGNQQDVYAQRFSRNGQKLGAAIKVNSSTRARFAGVSMNNAGDWAVVWQDNRRGIEDIYGQRFDAAGNRIGLDFKINDQTQFQASSAVVNLAPDGSFVVIWQDFQSSTGALIYVYGQRFNNQGQAIGSNFLIGGAQDTRNCDLAVAAAGNFNVVYQQNANILLQRFDNNGQALGGPIQVEDQAARSFGQYNPHVAINSNQNLTVVWEDRRQGNFDIFGQGLNAVGEKIGTNFQVNDDRPGSASQNQTDIAGRSDQGFWVTWVDPRNNHLDIYAQRYDRNHESVGVNFKVNDDLAAVDHKEATIDMDDAGNAVIVWRDYRNPTADIYGQRYDHYGQPQGANFRVNDDPVDDPERYGQFGPALAVKPDGSFIVTWHDQRHRHSGRDWVIYGQRYDSQGTPLGSNFLVSDDTRLSSKLWSKIATDSSGDFVVVWWDTLAGSWDIFGQRFAADGQRRGINFQINLPGTKNRCQWPDVSFGAQGGFCVVWSEGDDTNADLYARHFQADGTPMAVPVKINDNQGPSTRNMARISHSKFYNYFNVVWQDDRNGHLDIYAQLLDGSGNPIGANYRVNQDAGSNFQLGAKVAFSERFLYYTWEDTRTAGQGRDIYARVDELNSPPAIPKLLAPEHQAYLNVDVPQLSFEIPMDPDPNEPLHFIVEVSTDSLFRNYSPGGYFDSQSDPSGFSPAPPYQPGSGVCCFTVVTLPQQWPNPIPLAEGTYYWRVTAKDGFEKSQSSETRQFTVDRTPPKNVQQSLVNPQYPPDWYQPDSIKEVLVEVCYDEFNPRQIILEIATLDTMVVTENLPGGLSQRVQISIPVVSARDGLYLLRGRVIDQLGFWRDANSITFRLDRTPPSGTRAASIDTSRQIEFLVSWGGASDSNGVGLSGQYDVRVSDNSGPWQDWLHKFAGTQAIFTGEYGHIFEFEAAAYDWLGNEEIFAGVAETRTVVMPPPDFSLVIIPDTVAALAGDIASVKIMIKPQGGFNEWISLGIQDLPPTIQATIDPNPIQPGTQAELKLHISTQTPIGTYALQITGASSTLQHSHPLILQVGPIPDFQLVVQPDSATIFPGGTQLIQISLLADPNFADTVRLAVTGLPEFSSTTFSANPIRPGEVSTLTIITTANTPPGLYPLQFTGQATHVSHDQRFWLRINPTAIFHLKTTPDSVRLHAGQTARFEIGLLPDAAFDQTVMLTISGLPAAARATFAPPTIDRQTRSILTIETSRQTQLGKYALVIQGQSGATTAQKSVFLEILAPGDFQLRLEPTQAQIVAGASVDVRILILPENEFSDSVALAILDLPPGTIVNYKSPLERGWDIDLFTSLTTPPGNYPIRFVGTTEELTREAILLLEILAVPDFLIQVHPETLQVKAGERANCQVQIIPINQFDQPVTLTLSGLPVGVSATLTPAQIHVDTRALLTITAAIFLHSGRYQLQIIGTSSTELVRTANVNLEIQGLNAGATPNPFTPNDDGYNDVVVFNFSELNSSVGEIAIFNVRGKKVITLQQDFRWDGRNADGIDQPPGVYLYYVKANGKIIGQGALTLIR
ncbi:MAG: gliding motility-associated C-terminal domain-containing protein [candidate division KSB1 bacterium]|nr:gliding motility-associated C-terminal domain-containing protein [candidate division KSB1 bacterium]